MKRDGPKDVKIVPGSGAANQIAPDAFDKACRRSARVVALLESHEGKRLTSREICGELRISPDDIGSVIWLLCKLLEYRKISHAWANSESVWWVEQRYVPEPETDIRKLQAVARERLRP